MTTMGWCAVGLSAVLAGCAMGAAAPARPAMHELPEGRELADERESAELSDARRHAARAGQAAEAGASERERAEWKEAADGFMRLADRHRTSEWRLVYRRAAAESFLRAGDPDGAARAAELIRGDQAAGADTRADAARLAAFALKLAAQEQVREGKLEPIRIGGRRELRPRAPAQPWKRFIEAADAYADAIAGAGGARPRAAEEQAAALELFAAQVEFGHDNVEEAQRRLERLFERWPSTGAAADGVATYLATFLARKDLAGCEQAIERARAMLERSRMRAEPLAAAGGATPEERAVPGKIDAALAKLGPARSRIAYERGMGLLRGGKPREAAAALELYLGESPGGPEAANALYNQSVAYALAGEARKSAAARERLLAQYPDAPEVATATVALATSRLAAGEAARAVKLYLRYLEKWPDGDQRCLALGNVGSALEQAGRRLEAAARYRAFGLDERCAKADPDTAARALYNAGVLYYNARRGADARAAWTQLLDLKNVTDAISRSQIEEARERLKLLK
jgi:TolA-binding protein